MTLALRSLYEAYGYRKFRMNRFEEYDFYALHRDFLPNGQIISFTDLNGKLMALRPDVTLSIVKKAKEGMLGNERIYYTESVYRPARGMTGYQESFQVGIEYIGHVTPYATVEIVSLAAQSLSLISAQRVLDISHTGYLGGLLESLPLEAELRRVVRGCIEEKNLHELGSVIDGKLTEAETERLLAVAQLSGSFAQVLPRARALASGERMHTAVEELESLYTALSASGEASALRLDISISGDAKYYSGIILRGYISGVPSAVLSGGRYDPLLHRMEKAQLSALGFAIYFDELAHFLSAQADSQVDTVVLYTEGTNPAAVSHMVQSCIARGERVWAGTELPQGLAYGQVLEVEERA